MNKNTLPPELVEKESIIGRFVTGFRYEPKGKLPLNNVYENFIGKEGQIDGYTEHNDMYQVSFWNDKGGKLFIGDYPAELIVMYLID